MANMPRKVSAGMFWKLFGQIVHVFTAQAAIYFVVLVSKELETFTEFFQPEERMFRQPKGLSIIES
jgi:hypothetical protein